MNSVTLQTLVNRVLQRANLEGAIDYTNASPPVQFCSLAEVTDLINSSYSNEVYDLLRQYVGDNYYRKAFTFTTVQGQTLYSAPADLLSITSVDVYINGQFAWSALRYQESERNLLKAVPFGWAWGTPVRYQLQGSGLNASINFLAIPEAGYTVTLNYVPGFTPLVNLTDLLDDVNGWSEIAVLDAAAKLLIKDGQLDVAQYLDARKAALVAKVRAMGPTRHAGEPETVNMIAGLNQWGFGIGSGGWWE